VLKCGFFVYRTLTLENLCQDGTSCASYCPEKGIAEWDLIHGGLSQAYGLAGENGNNTEEDVGEGARARGGGCNHVKQEGGGEEGVGAKCCGYVLLKTEQDDGSVVSQQVTQDTYKDTYKDTFKDSYKDETMAPWYHRRQTFSKSTL